MCWMPSYRPHAASNFGRTLKYKSKALNALWVPHQKYCPSKHHSIWRYGFNPITTWTRLPNFETWIPMTTPGKMAAHGRWAKSTGYLVMGCFTYLGGPSAPKVVAIFFICLWRIAIKNHSLVGSGSIHTSSAILGTVGLSQLEDISLRYLPTLTPCEYIYGRSGYHFIDQGLRSFWGCQTSLPGSKNRKTNVVHMITYVRDPCCSKHRVGFHW